MTMTTTRTGIAATGQLDSATELERTIYRRLNGGNFGSTSLDCIRAVLHAADHAGLAAAYDGQGERIAGLTRHRDACVEQLEAVRRIVQAVPRVRTGTEMARLVLDQLDGRRTA